MLVTMTISHRRVLSLGPVQSRYTMQQHRLPFTNTVDRDKTKKTIQHPLPSPLCKNNKTKWVTRQKNKSICSSAHDFVARHTPVKVVIRLHLNLISHLRLRMHRYTRLAGCIHEHCTATLHRKSSVGHGREERREWSQPSLDKGAVQERGQHKGELRSIGIDGEGIGRRVCIGGVAEEFAGLSSQRWPW
jgi:hypothetical protein